MKLGETYYGFGAYREAIEAITRGLERGSVSQMDSALVYLGLAEAQLNDNVAAKGTFAELASEPHISPRTAGLWRLYAATLPAAN